jgi:hypothetical protein
MQLNPKDKSTLSYIKGEVVRVLMDFEIKLQRHEIVTLLTLCEFIDSVLLNKIDTRRDKLEDIMYARFMEWELILKSSKTKDVKNISKDLKSILTTKE